MPTEVNRSRERSAQKKSRKRVRSAPTFSVLASRRTKVFITSDLFDCGEKGKVFHVKRRFADGLVGWFFQAARDSEF